MKKMFLELKNTVFKIKIWIHDTILYKQLIRELISSIYLLLKFFTKPWSLNNRLLTLANAYREASLCCKKTIMQRMLEHALFQLVHNPKHATIWREKRIGWDQQPDLKTKRLTKTLILKEPVSDREKGVLYIAHEYNLLRLLKYYNAAKLVTEYFLVCSTSWSPTNFINIWSVAYLGQDPIFFQISNPSDKALYEKFNDYISPIDIMASDWINPDFYQPRPHDKREIDILMMAGWSRTKRHWLLFQSLRKMRRHLRVVLIGQDQGGRTADDVFQEAKIFGVADRIEIVNNASIELVTEYQCNSKISIILSMREGSCISMAESLFANTPIAMIHNAHIGTKRYVNPQTGILLYQYGIYRQLDQLIDESSRYEPRKWAMEHDISCFGSTKKLNNILQNYCNNKQIPWTKDIKPMCRRPDPIYVNQEDNTNMRSAYKRLYDIYGIEIGNRYFTSPKKKSD